MRSNKKLKVNHTDNSFSDGFSDSFSDDYSSTHSLRNRNSYTPTFTMSSSYVDTTTQFLINHPINPDCWRENVHAELEKFAQEKLKQASQFVPHNSPVKPGNRITTNNDYNSLMYNSLRCKLNQHSLLATSHGQGFAKTNQFLKLVDEGNGRHYGRMVEKAGTFRDMWKTKGLDNCEILLGACNVKCDEALIEGINTLSPISILMLLFLTDKYPTTTVEDQTYILHLLQEEENMSRGDTYARFKFLDNEFYKRFPTKDNCKNDFAEEDMLNFGCTF